MYNLMFLLLCVDLSYTIPVIYIQVCGFNTTRFYKGLKAVNTCKGNCTFSTSEVDLDSLMQQELEVKNTLREVNEFEDVSLVRGQPSQQSSSGDFFSAPVSRKMMANDASDLQTKPVLLVEMNTFYSLKTMDMSERSAF